MKPSIKITSVELGQNGAIQLRGGDLVVITGPNNSGKSQFLRDVSTKIADMNAATVIISGISIETGFNNQSITEYLTEHFPKSVVDSNTFSLLGWRFPLGQYEFGKPLTHSLYGLARLFSYFAETSDRLNEVNPTPSFDRTTTGPDLPIARCFANVALEKKVSEKFRLAFGKDLIVHRSAGSIIPVYTGIAPDWTKDNDRVSDEYVRQLELLDKLETQGDGMKAFAGLMLRIVTFDRSILLIDEPEAFLHPPQARLMGRLIAAEVSSGAQVFVSTHSKDIIQGIMDEHPSNLQFSRLTRYNNVTKFHWLEKDKTEKFLTDSMLRTSDALDGLFHDRVVLCESDRDALFYKEVLKAIVGDDVIVDTLFLSTNGKDRMPHFVEALRNLGVDPIVIADVDLIRSDDTLGKLVTAKGGNGSQIGVIAKRIVVDVNQRSEPISATNVKGRINEIIDEQENDLRPLDRDKIARISRILGDLSPFLTIKRSGFRALPGGQSQKDYRALDEALSDLDIFIVPEGELEGFLRSGGRKGYNWIVDALSRKIATDPELSEARSFVSRVFKL